MLFLGRLKGQHLVDDSLIFIVCEENIDIGVDPTVRLVTCKNNNNVQKAISSMVLFNNDIFQYMR